MPMEDLLFSNLALLAAAGILLSVFLLLSKARRREPYVPEAKGAWPFIGHLHLLAGPFPPHLVLGKMADRHGAIFTIRLGVHKALVVNSCEIARECLTTNDKVLAGRPRLVASEVMGYDCAMIPLSPYGEHWLSIRRMVTTELLSNRRVAQLQRVRESEVQASIKGLYDHWMENNGRPVEMKKVFGDITLNIIFKMIIGKRYEDEKDKQACKALRSFFESMGKFLLSDALPYLRWLDIGGHEKEIRDTARELDRAVQGWLDEHRSRRKLEGKRKGEEEDFMDIMISTIDEGQGEQFTDYDADTVIKSTCMSLVLAASDTSAVAITWALSLLLNNEVPLKRAQQELDNVIGNGRQVTENDLGNLPYIQAVIKESLRLYPPGPLAVPHQSMEDCTIAGYHVEKGTRVLFNLTKIQRDARVWEDPDEFRPERFLTSHKDFDVMGKNFGLIPFGAGRRICPAISMALRVVGLSLAKFLHGFKVSTPGNEPVDMTEDTSLTNLKPTPLQVLVKPRLPEHLYDA